MDHAVMDAGNQNQDAGLVWIDGVSSAGCQFAAHADVVAVDVVEEHHHHRDQNHHDARTAILRDQNVRQDNARCHRAQTVDKGLSLPVTPPHLHPMEHHTRLANGESNEHTRGVKGQQNVGIGMEAPNQNSRHHRENQDAVGEDKAVALARELAGHEPVLGHQGG